VIAIEGQTGRITPTVIASRSQQVAFDIQKCVSAALVTVLVLGTGDALAAGCGNNAAGFETWKKQFAAEARSRGNKNRALSALAKTRYATSTIRADRGQKSFKYSLEKFMRVRGANAIISQGKRMKRSNAGLFASLERSYGVPAGPLIAIWGMESGFGNFMGGSSTGYFRQRPSARNTARSDRPSSCPAMS
jgi:membrane-bound lytic murein transglycosylase B